MTTTYPAGSQRQPSGYTPNSPLYHHHHHHHGLRHRRLCRTIVCLQLPIRILILLLVVSMDTQSRIPFTHLPLLFLDLAGILDEQPSSYPYNNYPSQLQPRTSHYTEPSFNPTTYNSTGILNSASPPRLPSANVPNPYAMLSSNPYMPPTAPDPYFPLTSQSPRPHPHGAQRQYTLGGDGDGRNYDSLLPDANNSYLPNSGTGISLGAYQTPINTNTGYAAPSMTSPTKQYQQTPVSSQPLEEAPPGYNAGTAGVIGHWGKHS